MVQKRKFTPESGREIFLKKTKKPNHSSSCHNFGKVSFLKDHARFSIGIKVRARNNLYVTIIKINPHMHEIFLQRLHEMGPCGSTKGNDQLTR